MSYCFACGSEIDSEARFCPRCNTELDQAAANDEYEYEAFISYRHVPHDQKVARRLQRSLEGMAIPRGVRSAGNSRVRLGKLFRDEDELPTASSLPDQIREALQHSRYLIVVCSPQTIESRWVAREVELFASFHGRDRILVALAEGEPEQSFPHALRTRLVPNGDGAMREVEEEPLAADFRSDDVRMFRREQMRVAAALMGCGYDDLRQRQRVRRMRMVALVASVVALVSIVFGAFSWHQQTLIAQNYRQAQINESENLAVRANELLAHGNRLEAVQVAMSALPSSGTSDDRPLVPAAELALENALQVYPSQDEWQSCYAVDGVERTYAHCDGGLQAMELKNGNIVVTSIRTGDELCRFDPMESLAEYDDEGIGLQGMLFCKENLLCIVWDTLALFNSADGTLLWAHKLDGGAPLVGSFGSDVVVSPDGESVAVCLANDVSSFEATESAFEVVLLNAKDGTQRAVHSIAMGEHVSGLRTVRGCYNERGMKLAVAAEGHLFCLDLASGSVEGMQLTHANVHDVAYVGEDIVVIDEEEDRLSWGSSARLTIDCFAGDSQKRWSKDAVARSSFTVRGLPISARAKIVGAISSDEFSGDQLVMYCGSSILLLDRATGSVSYEFESNSPMRDAIVPSVAIQGALTGLVTIDASGCIRLCVPKSDPDSVSGSLYDWNVGETSEGSFVELDGELLAMSYDATAAQYRVFRRTSRSDNVEKEKLEGLAHVQGWDWSDDGKTLVGICDDAIVRIDANTFETLWHTPLAELKDFDASLGVAAVVDEQYVCVCEESGSAAIHVLSALDGSVVGVIDLGEGDEFIGDIDEIQAVRTKDDAAAVLVRRYDTIQLVSVADHRVLATVGLDEFDSGEIVRGALFTGDCILVSSAKEACGSLVPYAVADGKPLDAPIRDCVTPGGPGGDETLLALSPDSTRVAFVQKDGSLCLYSTEDWSLVWQTYEVPSTLRAVVFSADSRNLLIQDASGLLLLVAGDTGAVVRASSTGIGPIKHAYRAMQDDSALVVMYEYEGLRDDWGLAIVRMGEESFGPESDMCMGFCMSEDGSRVLAYNGSESEHFVYRRYTLDELMTLAHDVGGTRSLTTSEQRLYHMPSA